MDTKVCTKCEVEKELSEFGINKVRKSGIQNICKTCKNIVGRKWRDDNPEKSKQMADKWLKNNPERRAEIVRKSREKNPDGAKKATKKWRDSDKTRSSECSQKWQKRNPVKYKAHKIVANALRRGEIERQSCKCGAQKKANSHHSDYSKPLDIEWLCILCHNAWHKLNGPGING